MRLIAEKLRSLEQAMSAELSSSSLPGEVFKSMIFEAIQVLNEKTADHQHRNHFIHLIFDSQGWGGWVAIYGSLSAGSAGPVPSVRAETRAEVLSRAFRAIDKELNDSRVKTRRRK